VFHVRRHRFEAAHVVNGFYVAVNGERLQRLPYSRGYMLANCLFGYPMITTDLDSSDGGRSFAVHKRRIEQAQAIRVSAIKLLEEIGLSVARLIRIS
jgi:hypothetical protein